jgi:hypothetical protein
MTETRYYEIFESVKELSSPSEVNEHLKDGTWELIKIGEVSASESEEDGTLAQVTKLVYVVGLKRKSAATPQGSIAAPAQPAKSATPPKQPPPAPKVSVEDILGLPWADSDYAQVDAWVPSDKLPAAIAEHFRKTGEKTAKGSYKLSVGNYEVYLSPKGHLQRYLQK